MIKEFKVTQADVASRGEVVFIQYDTILQFNELQVFKYLMSDYDRFNKFLKLDLFRLYATDECITRALLERKEKDMIKWLIRDDNNYDGIYDSVLDIVNEMDKATLTDFARGIQTLLMQKVITKVYVYAEYTTLTKINVIIDLFKDYSDKFTLITKKNDTDNIEKIIEDRCSDVTTFFVDDVDIVKRLMEKDDVMSKTFIIPFTGYNFTIDEENVMISKNELEFTAFDKGCNIGFINLFNLKDEDCAVG